MRKAMHWTWRVLAALMVAALVGYLQYLIWGWSNRGVAFGDAAGDIGGYAYSPYQRDQWPARGEFPSLEEISTDLLLLSRSTTRIRTYGALDNPSIIPLAELHDLKVTAGAWLSGDHANNVRELGAAIASARDYRHVDRLIVGNEVLLRHDLSVEQLSVYLDVARKKLAGTSKAVSTAEPWHVWLKHPELAEHVDFITVHLLPFHEGVPAEQAVGYAMQRYDELARTFPGKPLVIGEIGWPSRGPEIQQAEASVAAEARFIREFLPLARERGLDYYLMEAFDQPWKVELEGWAGPYWGLFKADRTPKFPLDGLILNDIRWQEKALTAVKIAFVPMFLVALLLRGWGARGRLWLAALIQACVSVFVVSVNVPQDYYLTNNDQIGLVLLICAAGLTAAVLLAHGFEFGELMFKGRWRRRFGPRPPLPADQEPFVSIHLACCNEPPEMVIATIDSLARLDYRNFEVLVVDNNTSDPALWMPVEAHVATLGSNFRFFHLPKWPGFKAGALNFALGQTDARAEVVGVVDADYVVEPDWLSVLVPHFLDSPEVAVVQAPQAHRDWAGQAFRRMCNWEFDGFFRIGMHHRNERNALIQHGTMTLVRRSQLEHHGAWSEWCICEDTELGLRLIKQGLDTRYVDHVLGRGLTPSDFAAIKSQRFRWAFGAMQILKRHLPSLLGGGRLTIAQRYHFLTGWFQWLGDALQLVFVFASLAWTLGILVKPAAFGLPVVTLALPVLGFMVFKAALGPILYRRTMACPWTDILGASVLSVGLSHAIARGIFAGIIKRRGEFVRTPKSWKAKGRLAFFSPIREEIGLLVALLLAAAALFWTQDAQAMESRVWIGILLMQTLPYVGAILCQFAAYLPDRGAAQQSAPAVDARPAAV